MATSSPNNGHGKEEFTVELPAGGKLSLQSAEEVELWEESAQKYIDDFGLTKANDLMLLGAILSQGLAMFRAQQQLSDSKRAREAQNAIIIASKEIRELEKALGVDRVTREKGGQHTVADYVTRLKRAAHERGIHISERVKAYEALAMEARWKIRLLRNGDAEDRQYHGLSEQAIVEWLGAELDRLEEKDKEWAREKGRIFAGKL